MRKKELERQNEELLVKVEKQRLLIEKLNKDLAFEKLQTKTVYVDKIPIYSASDNLEPSIRPLNSKPDILDNYATYSLLKTSMPYLSSNVFNPYNNPKPLNLISFEEWYNSLTRNDLIGGEIKTKNKEVFEYLDSMDLVSLKSFFKGALKELYEKEKISYLEFLETTIVTALKKKEA